MVRCFKGMVMQPLALLIGCLFFGVQFTLGDSYAEMQPFYNLSVTIDRANEDGFNEKIEVYVTKDGEYYGDYDLNRSNQYRYNTEIGSGVYRLFARVRYDQDQTYQVEPAYQELVMKDIEYNDKHKVIFSVNGGFLPEGEPHKVEQEEPLDPDNVYTMDRIDELRLIQESVQDQASQAFYDNEKWEQKHNFLAQNGILNPGITAERAGTQLLSHYYPGVEPATKSEATNIRSQAETATQKTESANQSNQNVVSGEKASEIRSLLLLILVILFGTAGIGVYLKYLKK